MYKKLWIIVTLSVCFVTLSLCAGAEMQYNEAPMLAEKVAKGELPPVEERLPENPLVIEPVEGIGQYGGTWHKIDHRILCDAKISQKRVREISSVSSIRSISRKMGSDSTWG